MHWIQALFAAGLNSRTILELLPCVHSGVVAADMLDRLIQQRDRIATQITDLLATHDRLDTLVSEAMASTSDAASD